MAADLFRTLYMAHHNLAQIIGYMTGKVNEPTLLHLYRTP